MFGVIVGALASFTDPLKWDRQGPRPS